MLLGLICCFFPVGHTLFVAYASNDCNIYLLIAKDMASLMIMLLTPLMKSSCVFFAMLMG